MDINTSQVGQNGAIPRADIEADAARASRATEDAPAVVQQVVQQQTQQSAQQQVKGLSVSAEIETQESLDVSAEQIEAAVSQLSEFVQINSRQINFSVDEGSNKQVVRVTDSESGKTIRQIPSEEVLKISERLQDLQTEVGTAVGLLFNKQV